MNEKRKGWFINGCFIDFDKPVTYEEASKYSLFAGEVIKGEPTLFMKKFRDERLKNGLTISSVWKKTNIKPSRLCDLEFGREEPTNEEEILLADVVGLIKI